MSQQQIVIIGGGFTGTALAIHLARAGQAGLHVTVIEPRAQLAQGVAYGTTDPAHRINVPAARMQLAGDEEGIFDRDYRTSPAFQADPDALWRDGNVYPQRGEFGRWVNAQFVHQQQHSPVKLSHLRDSAVALQDGVVTTASGQKIRADQVVLAISHPPPDLPALLKPLQGHPGLIANPWQNGALAQVAPDDRVGIIGSGLTMSDVVASLHRQQHRGEITAFSRRGQLPRANLSGSDESYTLDYSQPQPASARGWLRRVRQEVKQAAALNLPWQLVLDDIRRNGQRIWQSLSLHEQQRFLHHLRPWWDVHRYRIAPQVSQILNQQQASGQLSLLAARLMGAEAVGNNLQLTLRRRGAQTEIRVVDKVIVTTGPAHNALLKSNALLRQLHGEGVIQPDPLALGIQVNALSQTLNAQGDANPHLFVAGPAARGRFGELMGLPQVAEHAESVARQLLSIMPLPISERCPGSLIY
ncbi:FAD/NAD(P)-binding protein [Pantoea agglomerans]|uniref:FAD/NAD(P)-binding protein n=1 Tax=Enterobacter agglomerans TaxID=549 RepID=UPI001F4D70B3|nr:FAD-dependent oxidoreductase [Pantoea agglomerans]MCH9407636.1 FAD-dependent oxidoreductase [Pantoea agglomerans]WNK33241.1 FAD-dependent oxidoreductase [Pantoea agglomerans]WNK65013.1 FAD-dependent oxidoreductase [Pantoea agglomerans]